MKFQESTESKGNKRMVFYLRSQLRKESHKPIFPRKSDKPELIILYKYERNPIPGFFEKPFEGVLRNYERVSSGENEKKWDKRKFREVRRQFPFSGYLLVSGNCCLGPLWVSELGSKIIVVFFNFWMITYKVQSFSLYTLRGDEWSFKFFLSFVLLFLPGFFF